MTKKWMWWASRNEEDYIVGPEPDRDAIIALARNNFDGEPFHIVEAVLRDVATIFPSAIGFVEDVLERAADDGAFGEYGDYDLLGTADEREAAIAELDHAISGWVERWRHILPTPLEFAKVRSHEWVKEPQP